MNLEELKAKAEAATPEACEPIRRFGKGAAEWYPVHTDGCRGLMFGVCSCDPAQRIDAFDAFIAAANPQVVLALVKVAEAMKAFIDFLGIIGIEVEEDQETILTERFGAYRMAWDELEAMG